MTASCHRVRIRSRIAANRASLLSQCQYTAPFVMPAALAIMSIDVLANPRLAKRRRQDERMASRVSALWAAFRDLLAVFVLCLDNALGFMAAYRDTKRMVCSGQGQAS